jgi:hypothetical protein
MSVTSLSLPVDIPWERWCVSEDMMDRNACDSDRPAKWNSSIVVFRYVPTEEYQTYPGRRLTYLKVVCTITGYQAKADEVQGILDDLSGLTVTDLSDEIEKATASIMPCSEALLQVTVAPPERSGIPLDRYPYFMDFQPKKREMIEMATDTNEFMSRSLENLNIGKSSGSTQSQEVLDVDKGTSVSGSAEGSYAGTGGGGSFSYSRSGEWGTKQMGGNQSGLTRTTDETHERRETVSHSTQITQMWHLLDSYHLGTNRALFFVQPRPHVLQAPSGFVGNSPRAIEGIQEFFLVVNQPVDTPEFCVGVRLDTGHLVETPVVAYDYRSETLPPTSFANPTPLVEDTDLVDDGTRFVQLRNDCVFELPLVGCVARYTASAKYNCKRRTRSSQPSVYTPPSFNNEEYMLDVANTENNPNNTGDGTLFGYAVIPAGTSITGSASYVVAPAPDGSALTISITGTSRACFKAPSTEISTTVTISPEAWIIAAIAAAFGVPVGPALPSLIAAGEAIATSVSHAAQPNVINQQTAAATVVVQVFLRSKEPVVDTGKKVRKFTVTTRGLCCCKEREPDIILREGFVYESKDVMLAPDATLTPEVENRLRVSMRQEMLRAIVSSRRTEPRPLAQTRLGMDLILPVLLKDAAARRTLQQPGVHALPYAMLQKAPPAFREALKRMSRRQLLNQDVASLAKASGLNEEWVHEMRKVLLRTNPRRPVAAAVSPKQEPPKTGKSKRRKS